MNRRWFLFGGAAALAVATIPKGVAAERLVGPSCKVRQILDIFCALDDTPTHKEHAVIDVGVQRGGGDVTHIMSWRVAAGGIVRWIAPWDEDDIGSLLLLEDDLLQLNFQPSHPGLVIPHIQTISRDDGRMFVNEYRFSADGKHEVTRLSMDTLPVESET